MSLTITTEENIKWGQWYNNGQIVKSYDGIQTLFNIKTRKQHFGQPLCIPYSPPGIIIDIQKYWNYVECPGCSLPCCTFCLINGCHSIVQEDRDYRDYTCLCCTNITKKIETTFYKHGNNSFFVFIEKNY
jgi:hypothetical protein